MTISRVAAQKLTVLIIIGLCVDFGTVLYVGYVSWRSQQDLVEAQRRACSRGKLDRSANASGWRIAQAARKAEGQLTISAKYGEIAAGQEARSQVDCTVVFPDAKVLP